MGICDEAANVSSMQLNSCRKQKGRGDGSLSMAETFAKSVVETLGNNIMLSLPLAVLIRLNALVKFQPKGRRRDV